jgi:hypothetical protein
MLDLTSDVPSAVAALAGALVGGVASLGSTWLAQWVQIRDRSREVERTRRIALFTDFIDEASRLYGDALSHEKNDVTDVVKLYAIVARIRLMAPRPIIEAAEQTLKIVSDAYVSPNRSLQEIQEWASEGKLNFLLDFSEACHEDLGFPASRRRDTPTPATFARLRRADHERRFAVLRSEETL